MMRSFTALTLAALCSSALLAGPFDSVARIHATSLRASDQAGAKPGTTLGKATIAGAIKTDQREMIAPESARRFLWVSATVAGAPQTIDLTKVVLTSGTATYPLVGVDSVHDGDPGQFSMVARVHLKTGKFWEPLEETRSVGTIAFAFAPGKVATLKVIEPPQSFCLLFVVPRAVRAGQIKGLSAADLTLPTVSVGKP